MNITRYTNLSDEEFVNALETLQLDTNSLILGPQAATELFERMRKWVKWGDYEELREENSRLVGEIEDLENDVRDLKQELSESD